MLVRMRLMSERWDSAYKRDAGVSWFEARPDASLGIIASLGLPLDEPLVDVGGGGSALAGQLAAAGYTDITVLDVSKEALRRAQERSDGPVQWLQEDVLAWQPKRTYSLWHDRALLHFFTDEEDRQAYRLALDAAVKPGGFAVLATFSPDGPKRCSGLPVRRYSPDDLSVFLGSDYGEVLSHRQEHRTPRGAVQPFTWAAFRRVGPPDTV